MERPIIHYDYQLGAFPAYRQAIHSALRGDEEILDRILAELQTSAPNSAAVLKGMHAYAKWGQQSYVVGPKLQRMLMETEASSIPREFIRPPYPGFYIALPNCNLTLWGGDYTGWHPVSGIYVTMVYGPNPLYPHDNETMPGLLVSLWGRENDQSRVLGDDANMWMIVPLHQEVAMVDIDTIIFSILDNPENERSDMGVTFKKGTDLFETQTTTARVLLRLVFNLILYLNSKDPEIDDVSKSTRTRRRALQKKLKTAKTKKRKKLQRSLDKMSEAQIVWIGKSLEKQPNPDAEPGSPRESGKRRRHLRKGHFHPYWVGARKDEEGNLRKGTHMELRWLKPQWVGSDMADMVHLRGKQYQFIEEKDDYDE